jgi:ABC-type bacteriocin/lantibiotic exporter with double-glycine peptidase domain
MIILLFLCINIPVQHRVYNESGQQCLWCSCETLGKFHELQEVNDLHKYYRSSAQIADVVKILRQKGIKVYWENRFAVKGDAVDKYVNKYQWGIAVEVEIGSNKYHMVVVVEYDKHYVRYIENSEKGSPIRAMPRTSFDSKWTGGYIVIVPRINP